MDEFEYEKVYKKESLNKNADALSRVELNLNETEPGPSSPPIFDFIFDFMDEFNESMKNRRVKQQNLS